MANIASFGINVKFQAGNLEWIDGDRHSHVLIYHASLQIATELGSCSI